MEKRLCRCNDAEMREIILDYPEGPKSNDKCSLHEEREEGKTRTQRRGRVESEAGTGGHSHAPRKRGPRELEEVRKALPESLQKEHSPSVSHRELS